MIKIETLSNGLTVVLEEISHLESVAYELFIPGGLVCDRDDRVGSSLILAELITRGAGELDSKQISDAFDALGVRHSESAEHERFVLRGSLLGENLEGALKLSADMALKPRLPENEVANIRSLLLLDLAALEDNPAQKAMTELSKRYYPKPFNRSSLGDKAGLQNCTIADLRAEWEKKFRPHGSILSIAGRIDCDRTLALAKKYFGNWQGKTSDRAQFGSLPALSAHHLPSESAQLQIVLAYPSAHFGHDSYYAAKVATGVLSGGMFGRLFIEVREKRGLVYSVAARHSATSAYGTCVVYAGTTPERAQETLDVIVTELNSVAGTVSSEELSRAKANLLTSLVMGEESSSSRAGSNASDYWHLGRVRTLDEIQASIEAVTADSIDRYLSKFPCDSFALLTLGSRQLTLPRGVGRNG